MDLARQNGTFEKYLEITQRICDDRFAGVSKRKGKKLMITKMKNIYIYIYIYSSKNIYFAEAIL